MSERESHEGPRTVEVDDIRDAALKGIQEWGEEVDGLDVMVAMSRLKFGVVYINGVTSFVVEIHSGEDVPPRGVPL